MPGSKDPVEQPGLTPEISANLTQPHQEDLGRKMTYKSRHELMVVQGSVTPELVEKFLLEQNRQYPDGPADWCDVLNRYPTEWKDRDEQMLTVSRNWPQAVFSLDVQGEDELEITREYYGNGMSYTVQAEIPPFDPARLGRQAQEDHQEDQPEDHQEDQPEDQWDPSTSICPGLRAQDLLNEALWDLEEANAEYPKDEQLDQLAPSLRSLVMQEIRLSNLQPCRREFQEMADMGHNVIAKLPIHEKNALQEAMRAPAGMAGG